jgi:glycosyltransferase involved in cell wall biosynthesis
MSHLLFSVVMPTRNQVGFIEKSIRSVLEQDYPAIELIVADGNSTDGTQALLQRLAAQDSRIRWFSEPDTGPANALNKALARVKGTLVGWLNSDDLYTPGALSRAAAVFAINPRCMMAYGHGQHIDIDDAVLDTYPTLPPEGDLERFEAGCFICQPAVTFRRTLPLLLGDLDETLSCSFDFDYWLRAFKAFPGRIAFIDAVQAQSRLHDDCITSKARRQVALEGVRVLHTHLQHAPKEWLLSYLEELRGTPSLREGIGDIAAHMQATLDEAACWLSTTDIELVKRRIQTL